MNLPSDLKEMERRAFRSTFQDGLWDLWIAQFLIMLSIEPLFSDLGFSDFAAAFSAVPINLLFLVLLWMGKKWITTPRLGSVRFSDRRQSRIRLLLVLSVLLLIIGVLEWYLPALLSIPMAGVMPLVVASFLLANFTLLALILNLPRFYAYGMVAALAVLAGDALYQRGLVGHHGWTFMFGVSGAVIGLVGLILLVRFMRLYPVATAAVPE